MHLYSLGLQGLSGILAPPLMASFALLAVTSTYEALDIDLTNAQNAGEAGRIAGYAVLVALVVPLVLNILRLQWRDGGRLGWWPSFGAMKLGCLWLSWSFTDCFGVGVVLVVWSHAGSNAAGTALGAIVWLRLILCIGRTVYIALYFGCRFNPSKQYLNVPAEWSDEARMVIKNVSCSPGWDFVLEAPKYAVLAAIWTVVAS